MSAILLPGPSWWEGSRDDEGYREYKIRHKVRVSNRFLDGPATVMNCPGLPAIGSFWAFGGEVDPWAFCYPTMRVTIDPGYKEGEAAEQYTVEQKFSQRPLHRCQDISIQDPLLEPDRISGTFVRDRREMTRDRNGNAIAYSSTEPVRGPGAEFDFNRPTVMIKQNQATLGLNIFSPLVDCVNSTPLWGMPPRCVKFSCAQWERVLFGLCSYYYTITLIFEVSYLSWDHYLVDSSDWVLNGHWGTAGGSTGTGWILDNIGSTPPNPLNPAHYIRATDRAGNPKRVLLNGAGIPIGEALTGPIQGAIPEPGWEGTRTLITSLQHQLGNPGDTVSIKITGVNGATNLNGTFTVTVLSADEFRVPVLCGPSPYQSKTGGWQATTPPTTTQRPFVFAVQYYPGVDLTILGIPVSF